MKNTRRKKLSLDKIKIAQLNHLDSFRGGSQDTANQHSNNDNCFTKPHICETILDCGVSTKTIPIVDTIICLK